MSQTRFNFSARYNLNPDVYFDPDQTLPKLLKGACCAMFDLHQTTVDRDGGDLHLDLPRVKGDIIHQVPGECPKDRESFFFHVHFEEEGSSC